MEERLDELERRVDKLEKREEELIKHDELMLGILKDLVGHLARMKHPATNFALIMSIAISTIINNLPMLIGILFG